MMSLCRTRCQRSIADNVPAVRESQVNRDTLLVMKQVDGDILRTVSIHLEDPASLPLDVALPVRLVERSDVAEGAERLVETEDGVWVVPPDIKLSSGDLIRDIRNDGAEVLSSTNTKFAEAVSGSLTLRQVDGALVGEFDVELDVGGSIHGGFTVER